MCRIPVPLSGLPVPGTQTGGKASPTTDMYKNYFETIYKRAPRLRLWPSIVRKTSHRPVGIRFIEKTMTPFDGRLVEVDLSIPRLNRVPFGLARTSHEVFVNAFIRNSTPVTCIASASVLRHKKDGLML